MFPFLQVLFAQASSSPPSGAGDPATLALYGGGGLAAYLLAQFVKPLILDVAKGWTKRDASDEECRAELVRAQKELAESLTKLVEALREMGANQERLLLELQEFRRESRHAFDRLERQAT